MQKYNSLRGKHKYHILCFRSNLCTERLCIVSYQYRWVHGFTSDSQHNNLFLNWVTIRLNDRRKIYHIKSIHKNYMRCMQPSTISIRMKDRHRNRRILENIVPYIYQFFYLFNYLRDNSYSLTMMVHCIRRMRHDTEHKILLLQLFQDKQQSSGNSQRGRKVHTKLHLVADNILTTRN